MIALIVGVLVVVQAQYWLTRLGQTALIGPILTAVVLRELGPLLTNFVVIARSGTAISTELANMKVHGEVRAWMRWGLIHSSISSSRGCLRGGFHVLPDDYFPGRDVHRRLFLPLGHHAGRFGHRALSRQHHWVHYGHGCFTLLAKSILPGMLTARFVATRGWAWRGGNGSAHCGGAWRDARGGGAVCHVAFDFGDGVFIGMSMTAKHLHCGACKR